MVRVGIVGASGFTGAELLRLLASHPEFTVDVVTADSQAGRAVAEVHPSLAAAYPHLVLQATDADGVATCAGLDLVFCALPHGASQSLMVALGSGDATIVDLAADFRLGDPSDYDRWYGEAHTVPALLEQFVYGLPETSGASLPGATRIAAPGCYPTAAALALAPLCEAGLIETNGVVVDAASGVSGAGRPARDTTTFCAVDGNFSAYGVFDHRHTPEIEQSLARAAGVGRDMVRALFTPHLAPMSRGILATCYARPSGALPPTQTLVELYRDRYEAHPFVVTTVAPPSTKATLGSNMAHVSIASDPRTGWVLAMCAIDNLVKGASGQAIQAANVALGLDETAGLPMAGVSP